MRDEVVNPDFDDDVDAMEREIAEREAAAAAANAAPEDDWETVAEDDFN